MTATRSIRRQLTIQILVGTLVLLFAAGAIFMGVIHSKLVRDFDQLLEQEAAMLIRNTEIKHRTLVWDVPDAYSAGSRDNADPGFCELFLENGMVAGQSQTLGTDDLPLRKVSGSIVWNATLPSGRSGRLLQKTFRPATDNTDQQVLADDPREQTFAIPEEFDPERVGIVIVVARSRDRLDALLRSLYLAGGAGAVVLACALTWLVRVAVGRGLRPVDEINAQIARIAPDALDARLHIAAPPVELAAIETAVNRLLDRVERALEKERRFSSNLAHELRTPIAELRNVCEVGERWPEDVAETRQYFRDTGVIALQLEKLVATMLTLSRCEEGAAPAQTQRIPLAPLLRDCWQHAAAGAELRFENLVADEVSVVSDASQLEVVLLNLLSNAAAHSELGTRVECSASAASSGIELCLANTARDLEPADLEHLFDRFWRKDSARGDRSHAGLGLSIVHGLCELLGIRLNVALDGNRFEMRLHFPPAAER